MEPFRDAADFLDDPPAGRRAMMGWLDVAAYLEILRRRAFFIVGATVVGLALGMAAYLASPPRYDATAILLIDPRQQNVLSSESVLSGFGQDAAAVESQVELITSTAVLGRVVETEGLASDPEFVSGGLIAGLLGAQPQAASPERDAQVALSALTRRLRVQRRGLTYVLEIVVSTGSAEKSARIANAIANTYLSELVGARVDATRTANDFLADRIDALRNRVEESERAVADFRASSEILDAGQGDTLLERRVAQLGADLAEARARVIEAQARRDQLALVGERLGDLGSLGDALQSTVVSALRIEYAELERSVAELELVYGPGHPVYRQAAARLARAEGRIASELERIAAAVDNELETAQRREASLLGEFEDLQRRYTETGSATVRLRELEREAEANRAVYEQALLRLRETGEQEGLRIADARLVSPAAPALRKSAPNGTVMLAAGGVLGLLGGLAFALFAEATRRGFRSPDEAAAALGMACLGSLPRTAKRGFGRRGPAGDDEIATAAIRAVRSRLRGADASRILVTSVANGEGKTNFALALAFAFAEKGQRTLALDLDAHGLGLGTALGVSGAAGFADVLAGAARPRDVIVAGAGGRPAVVGCGSPSAMRELPDLLDDADVGGFFEMFGRGYERMVVDAPPLRGGAIEVASALGAGTVGVLVVEAERTTAAEVEQALRQAGIPRSAFAGFVLTKSEPGTVPVYRRTIPASSITGGRRAA